MTGQEIPLERATGTGRRENWWLTPAICIGLVALTFAVFGQTLFHPFIAIDDGDYVYNNLMVRRGLTAQGVGWAFSTFDSENWHPLTWLSHMLDCQLYGLNPTGHHLTSVLFHTATVVLLFLALRGVTGAVWRSAFVAAVFAVHPLRVESVAWVAERKDVMSGLFFVLTIWAYAHYARGKSAVRYGLVTVLLALGLMCKPMLVTLPVVLLLLDYWPLRRAEPWRKLAVEKLPWFGLSAASCAATLLAQAAAIQTGKTFALPLRLANAVNSCAVYLRQMIWPAGLTIYYPYPHGGLPGWQIAVALIVLTVISIFAWVERRKMPWVLVGWLWYLVMLVPVLGVVQVGVQPHADRYTYLPQIGIYVALTWLAGEWALRWKRSEAALGLLMAGIVGVLAICAFQQAGYWEDGEILWRHALANATEGSAGDVALIHYNLGLALRQDGNWEDAIEQYEKALETKPDYVEAQINLGSALLQVGKLDESISHLEKALRINPGYGQAENDLGNAYLQKGDAAEAIDHYQKAAKLEPDDPWVMNNLAWIYAAAREARFRNGAKAVELATQASRILGRNAVVLHTLAAALAEAGRFPEAVTTAQEALGLAQEQSNDRLAGQLQTELNLYQTGNPFHLTDQK